MRLMCRVLKVPPSGYYAWRSCAPSKQAQARAARDAVVQEAFLGRKGRAGAPRLAKQLGIGRRQVAQTLSSKPGEIQDPLLARSLLGGAWEMIRQVSHAGVPCRLGLWG